MSRIRINWWAVLSIALAGAMTGFLLATIATGQCVGSQCPPGGCSDQPWAVQSIRGPLGATATRACGPGGQTAIATGIFGNTAIATQGPAPPLVARPPGRIQLSPATVRIQSNVGATIKHGTGTVIDVGQRWHVLTAAHILAPNAIPRALVNGQWVSMRIVGTDALHDVALLYRLEDREIPATAIPLVRTAPATARWQGYAYGGTPMDGGGRVIFAGGLIAVPGQAASGTSGGPIYCRGGLLSVITEVNDGPGYWVTAGPRPEWLTQWVDAVLAGQSNGTSPGGVAGPDGPPPPTDSDRLPARPLVHITREEFDQHSLSITKLSLYVNGQTELNQEIQNQLMDHSAAIAELQAKTKSNRSDIAALDTWMTNHRMNDHVDIEARVAAIEATEYYVDENGDRKRRPLFIHETYINGKFVGGGDVWRGDTLKYTSELIDGAPTDSFKVEVDSTGGTK